ncbi:MAG TPA: AMP-binding protein [Candidatus Aminicenantes bacterium]|nr:AMP-binding protein [Candidatus Aminicenantes bacterium]
MLLHQEFIRNAKRFGSKPAIIDRFLDKNVSYEKALIASLILANKFRRYRDGFIGVMVPTSAGCMLSILGVLMAGKVPVMINFSTGAANNAEYAQRKCGFKTIIASRALLEKIGCRLVSGMVFIEDIMAGVGPLDKVAALVKAKLPLSFLLKAVHEGEPDDNLVILFTSGSEKDPKAVQLTHRNIGSNVRDIGRVLTVTSEDVMLANLPLFHVFGHNVDFWLPLLYGMTIVAYANPLEYRKISSIVREEKVSLMVGTPSFFTGYLRQSDPGDFATLRVAVAGADKTPDSLREGFLQKHGLELCEGYGTTETSPVVSTNLPGANKPGSIGKVLPGVRVKIVDINTGEALPPGGEGKILVKGDLVMKGYFDDLEETSLRIKDGWYETGDMGVLDEEGYLWHRGRLKRFVKIGGEMVSLVRVETVMQGLLPEGVDCCVVEVPDSLKGAKIVAAVTAEVSERRLLKAMAGELPAIALPKQFVVLGEFPKMGSGKIDFRSITEMVRQQLQS